MHTSTDLPITSEFWQALFQADSIAVIGANNNVSSWGYDAFQTSLTSKTTKADRRVYPVNPSAKEVQGIPAFATILDIPDKVDLAIIVVRAEFAESVMRQCAEKKIKAVVIISAGFAETGADGAHLQDNILKIAHSGGFHIVGPNCVGHGDVHTLVASAGMLKRFGHGPFSLLSQSGTLGGTILQMASERGLGISKFVSTGNEGDLSMEDYLEYLGKDEKMCKFRIGIFVSWLVLPVKNQPGPDPAEYWELSPAIPSEDIAFYLLHWEGFFQFFRWHHFLHHPRFCHTCFQ